MSPRNKRPRDVALAASETEALTIDYDGWRCLEQLKTVINTVVSLANKLRRRSILPQVFILGVPRNPRHPGSIAVSAWRNK
jgi:hypothetical protein